MKYEELALVNQQLAGMLKSGIPLEGALRQLSANMRRGRLREELQALEADLAKGVPLKEALATRALPEFYVKMVQLGARTGDLRELLVGDAGLLSTDSSGRHD
jgi:type II secretory pathway component PulF